MLHLVESDSVPPTALADGLTARLACGRRLVAVAGEPGRIVVDRLECLSDTAALTELRQALPLLGNDGRVDIGPLDRGEQLVAAGIVALAVHFAAPEIEVRAQLRQGAIVPELVGLFERAAGRPASLLRAVDQATFARVHYLVGTGDDEGVARFARWLDIVDLIAGEDRPLARRLARQLRVRKQSLQLMITRRCHLRCVYCPIDKRDEDLTMDHALAALDVLLRGESGSYQLDLSGGEPLLRKDLVRQIIETSHRRAAAAGKKDSYYLVTNAIELDEVFCRFLSDFDIELEISIDGAEATHNKSKVTVDKRINPYRSLVASIQHLHHYDLHYNAVLVFTPDTFANLRVNLEHVLALGFRNISINYAIGSRWPAEMIDRYLALLAELVERYDMVARGQEAPFFINNLRYKSEPTVLNSELMVDCDGSLHLLSEWQFHKGQRRHPPPFGYALDTLRSIDDVYFTRAQVYHLLWSVYRSPDRRMLEIVHNSVQAGLQVAHGIKALMAGQRPASATVALSAG